MLEGSSINIFEAYVNLQVSFDAIRDESVQDFHFISMTVAFVLFDIKYKVPTTDAVP